MYIIAENHPVSIFLTPVKACQDAHASGSTAPLSNYQTRDALDTIPIP